MEKVSKNIYSESDAPSMVMLNVDSHTISQDEKIGNKVLLASTKEPDSSYEETAQNYDVFEKSRMLERMNKYLDSVTDKDLTTIVRGVRKHVEKFRKKVQTDYKLYERMEKNSDFIDIYFYCVCLKQYLRQVLDAYDIDISINTNMDDDACIGNNDWTITMNLNPTLELSFEDVTKNLAHEMWHHKQIEMAYDPEDDVRLEDTAAYQNAFENYIRPEISFGQYFNQPLEVEARLFGDEFLKRFIHDHDVQRLYTANTPNNYDMFDDFLIADYERECDDDLLRSCIFNEDEDEYDYDYDKYEDEDEY